MIGSIPNYNKSIYAIKQNLWHNLIRKEITISIHPSSTLINSTISPFHIQEIQKAFKNCPSKEKFCTDKPLCSNQPKSLDFECNTTDN